MRDLKSLWLLFFYHANYANDGFRSIKSVDISFLVILALANHANKVNQALPACLLDLL